MGLDAMIAGLQAGVKKQSERMDGLAYFLGIDSGGTKTECWLATEDRVLARGTTGSVKLTRVGVEVATIRLKSLLHEVAEVAGVQLGAVRRTCMGVAGYSIAEVRDWARGAVKSMVGGEVEICGDEEIALDAAFHGGPGILVIGGTGSNVVGRCRDGRRFTAGGWGPAIGDEGSGYWIGVEAVRAAFKAVDRGLPTGLPQAVRVAWGLADIGAVVGHANQQPGPDFAALAPVVLGCAEAGDPVAAAVLEHAGSELGEQVLVVLARMRERGEERPDVACTGSVLEKIAPVMAAMEARIGGQLRVRREPVNALEGALWRARRGSSSDREGKARSL